MDLKAIRLTFGNLIREIDAKIEEAQEVEEVKNYLTSRELDLRKLEASLNERQQELAKAEKASKEESDYNASFLSQLEERQAHITSAERVIEAIAEQEENLKLKQLDIKMQEQALEKKKRLLVTDEKIKAQYEKDQALVKKELDLMEERKKKLDDREAELKLKEQQLKKR